MIKCEVYQNRMGHLTVTFSDGKSFYLQSDYDRAAFAVDCGLATAPDNWDGCSSSLPGNWFDVAFDSITQCPDDYEQVAYG